MNDAFVIRFKEDSLGKQSEIYYKTGKGMAGKKANNFLKCAFSTICREKIRAFYFSHYYTYFVF